VPLISPWISRLDNDAVARGTARREAPCNEITASMDETATGADVGYGDRVARDVG